MDPPSSGHTAPWTLHHQVTQHLQNRLSKNGDSGPLHHQATQHLPNSYSTLGDRGPLHHQVTQHLQNSYSKIADRATLHHQVTQRLQNRHSFPSSGHTAPPKVPNPRHPTLPKVPKPSHQNLPIRPTGCAVSRSDVNSHPVPKERNGWVKRSGSIFLGGGGGFPSPYPSPVTPASPGDPQCKNARFLSWQRCLKSAPKVPPKCLQSDLK